VTRNGVPVGESTTTASALISMPRRTRTQRLVAEGERLERGVLDTSVLIDLDEIGVERLPKTVALTIAEPAAGPHAAADLEERSRRQDRLQRAEAAFDPIPFDLEAARAYGRVFAAISATGLTAGPRVVDLLIAATALALGLPLYTRNGDDFRGLEKLLPVVVV
jgi:predicted nucleic acid-binding protein